METTGIVKRKKFNPPMKTDKLVTSICTYGKAQTPSQEPFLCTREREELAAVKEGELHNHTHTLLSYCDHASECTAITTTESDSDSSDSQREDNDPPRRHFKTGKSEPCRYNYSVLPNSKRTRTTKKKEQNLALSTSKPPVPNMTVFEFPDTQLQNKMKLGNNTGIKQCEEKVGHCLIM